MRNRTIDRRAALALLGGGVGAVTLAACSGTGGNGEDTGASSSSTTGETAASPATTSGTPSGGVTASMFEGAASCGVTPEQTEGPYYLDVDQIRADIREDRPGTPLRVAARVVDSDGCTPIKDAVLEIWHCDADGSAPSERFLRGAQVTNAEGIAQILTVYPGWYQGRTPHIHAKVFISNAEALTTQFYFDDEVSSAVYAAAPYNTRSGRQERNADDGIFSDETVLTLSKDGSGYLGLITVGVRR
jgi:protocatechuate 3,4-dioxygenase beta subunit